MRLNDRVLIWRRGRTWKGRLCAELSGSVLIEALELIVLVVVETILSKKCVSPLAASNVGCAAAMRVRLRAASCMRVDDNETSNTKWHHSYWRRCGIEVVGGGRVGVGGRQRRDAHGKLVVLRVLRRPREIGGVLRVVHCVGIRSRRGEEEEAVCGWVVRLLFGLIVVVQMESEESAEDLQRWARARAGWIVQCRPDAVQVKLSLSGAMKANTLDESTCG